jgi:hypothetical protein
MKMPVLWGLAPCSLVEIGNASEVPTAFISVIPLLMEAVSALETSISFCENVRRNVPEDKTFSYSSP